MVAGLAIAASGCGRPPAERPESANRPARPAMESPASAPAEATKSAAAPDLVVTTVKDLDGKLAAYRGKQLIVDVWATWCTPCLEKFPKYRELAEANTDPQRVFVTLAVDCPEADVRGYLKEKGGRLPHFLVDEDAGLVQDHWQFEGVPHYLIFDGTGKVTFRASEFEALATHLQPPPPPDSAP